MKWKEINLCSKNRHTSLETLPAAHGAKGGPGGVRASEAWCPCVPGPPSVGWHPDHLPALLCTPTSPGQASASPEPPPRLCFWATFWIRSPLFSSQNPPISQGPASLPLPWERFRTLPLHAPSEAPAPLKRAPLRCFPFDCDVFNRQYVKRIVVCRIHLCSHYPNFTNVNMLLYLIPITLKGK